MSEQSRPIALEELQTLAGQTLGTSPWLTLDQDQVTQFAQCTLDEQWIHTDPARAQEESPFGTTIAHGYLTLSLIPFFASQVFVISDARLGINYGLNRVRFPAPVPTGSRLRGVIHLQSVDPIEGGVQYVLAVQIEIDGQPKPACVAEAVFRALR